MNLKRYSEITAKLPSVMTLFHTLFDFENTHLEYSVKVLEAFGPLGEKAHSKINVGFS